MGEQGSVMMTGEEEQQERKSDGVIPAAEGHQPYLSAEPTLLRRSRNVQAPPAVSPVTLAAALEASAAEVQQ